jgi:class 3 adenylate cyclase
VTSPPLQASRRQGALLLADISGYTRFLKGVADAHRDLIVEADEPPAAYAVLSHLLDTMVGAIAPAFRLAKFEGDAIFAVTADTTVQGSEVLDTLHRCYAAFRGALASAGSQWICNCDACARVGELDLKFVVHHGSYVAQPIAGREEFLGSDVNVAHRLLKNHAQELVGPVPYALVTDAAAQALDIPTEHMAQGEEAYDEMPPVTVHVLALADRRSVQ